VILRFSPLRVGFDYDDDHDNDHEAPSQPNRGRDRDRFRNRQASPAVASVRKRSALIHLMTFTSPCSPTARGFR